MRSVFPAQASGAFSFYTPAAIHAHTYIKYISSHGHTQTVAHTSSHTMPQSHNVSLLVDCRGLNVSVNLFPSVCVCAGIWGMYCVCVCVCVACRCLIKVCLLCVCVFVHEVSL
ncbi:hypothetical protein PAMP_010143 [Pampus punctatissimus]